MREVAGVKVVHQRVVDPHLGLRHVLKLQAERADQAVDIGDRQLGRVALAVGGNLQPFNAKRPRAVLQPLPPDRFRRQFAFITAGGGQLLRRKRQGIAMKAQNIGAKPGAIHLNQADAVARLQLLQI